MLLVKRSLKEGIISIVFSIGCMMTPPFLLHRPTHWSSPSVSEYWPSQTSLNRSQQIRQQRNFKEFLRDSGFTDRCETNMNYRSLARHSQTNFVNQMKKVLQFIGSTTVRAK